MVKARWLGLGAWFGIILWGAACTLVAGIEGEIDVRAKHGGGLVIGGMGGGGHSVISVGGTGGMGGVGGGSAGMGGMPECTMPSHCPPTPNDCVIAICNNFVCGTMNVPDQTGMPAQSSVSQQTAGDCKADVCDGTGNIVTVEYGADTDDDQNECTTDTCGQGFPVHTVTPGQNCSAAGGIKCNTDGKCVECLVIGDCKDAAKPNCDTNFNKCVADSCFDVVMNNSETDVDCGGPDCSPCLANANCMVASDCLSLSCINNKCALQGCSDGVFNQGETDIDCGGGCSPCANGQTCLVYAGCESGVCLGGKCQAHACNDWIQNGAESDVDCGGDTCAKCPDGKNCMMVSDCVNGACVGGVCTMGGMGGGGMGGTGGMGGAGGN